MALHKSKRGLRLPISGEPTQRIEAARSSTRVALLGADYPGMRPTMHVKAGETVKRGQLLFEDKKMPVAGWLVALNGKHKGEDFKVREGKTSIGCDPGNDVVLKDDYISTNHATIKFVEKDGERIFILTDLDSSNGTFLNDAEEPIAREELVDNDTVTFGQTKMKFKCL